MWEVSDSHVFIDGKNKTMYTSKCANAVGVGINLVIHSHLF